MVLHVELVSENLLWKLNLTVSFLKARKSNILVAAVELKSNTKSVKMFFQNIIVIHLVEAPFCNLHGNPTAGMSAWNHRL